MFSSAKKYLEDSAKSATSGADQLLTHTRGIMSTVKVYESCHKCNAQISVLGNYLTNQNTCRMCCKLYCNACIAKSTVAVPNHLLDISFQNKNRLSPPERQFLCLHRCAPRVVNLCMQEFRKEITERFESYVNAFVADELKQHFFFTIPKESPEDTAYRKALRMIHIAGVVAGMSGYAMTYNAVKYAYYSSELVNILTEGGILGILNPLMDSLKQCGIDPGPTALLRLYYLGCYHTLQSKMDTSQRAVLYEAEKPGVLYTECPLPVLEYVNSYMSAAQWMYLSSLPPPHQENDWGSWYLSQIIRRQGWSLLMCINDSSKLPDGSKCPAFALVTRCFRATTSAEGTPDTNALLVKEAMLVIRGSKSIMDWSINLEDEMCDYSFTHIVRKDAEFPPGKGGDKSSCAGEMCTSTVQGVIHKGLYTAAMGLLEGYDLRNVLMRLLNAGYQVKVVGHSLGAGIAALIAAELRVTLIAKHLDVYTDPESISTRSGASPMSGVKATAGDAKMDAGASPASPLTPPLTPVGVTRPESGLRTPEYLTNVVSAISAVVFSSPAFLTPNLAEAFLQDRILINTIYDRDIIPRFSFKTIQHIAEELKDPDFCAQADIWTQEDKSDFSAYAASMGKASDILKTGAAAADATAEELDAVDADIAVPVAEALAMHDGAASNSASSAGASAASGTVGDMSLRPPAKPSKPAKPDKIKSVTSLESCASYCTADGDSSPLSPNSRTSAEYAGVAPGSGVGIAASTAASDCTALHAAGSTSTLSSSSTTASGAKPTATAPASTSAAAAEEPAPAPAAPSMRSFVQSMSAWHALATNVIDKLQTANDNVGAPADVRQNRPVATTASTTSTAAPAMASAVAVPAFPDTGAADSKPSALSASAAGVSTAVLPATAAAAGAGSPPKPKAHTVTPGPIVHLYKENDGTVRAAVVTHAHSAFQRMQIIPAHSAEDHLMGTVREGMRSALFQHQFTAPFSAARSPASNKRSLCAMTAGAAPTENTAAACAAEVLSAPEEQKKFERYFNITVNGPYHQYPAAGTGPSLHAAGYGAGQHAHAQAGAGLDSTLPVSGEKAVAGTAAAQGSSAKNAAGTPLKIYRSISADLSVDTTTSTTAGTSVAVSAAPVQPTVITATGVAAYDTKKGDLKGTTAVKSSGRITPTATGKLVGKQWVPCAVCGLDVTWPYVLHSDASRAIVAHNCRKCGEVVCSLCAPAGDTLPGDGLNQSYQLSDYRVSLPECGLFSPQRVCLLCYFDT